MGETDEMHAIRGDVERAVELFIQLSYFTLGSTVGDLDAGRFRTATKHRRSRRTFRGVNGAPLVTVLPGGTIEQGVSRTGRAGRFPLPESDSDAMLWKSTIARKLGRLDPAERSAMDVAARLRVVNRALRNVISNTDNILRSNAAKKRLSVHDVRLMQAETDEILRVLARDVTAREWSGHPVDRVRKEQGYRRQVMDACAKRRRSVANSQVYANAVAMFAILCGPNRDYCLHQIPA